MKYKVLLPLSLVVCLASGMAAPQTASERAKDQLDKGIQAYQWYKYELAVEHFRQARKLDPQSRTAALCLATALAQEYVPGVDTPDNLQFAAEAIEINKQLLAQDPQNLSVLKWLGFLELETKRYEEAKSYYHQTSQADPKDAEALYSVGIVDWIQAYKRRVEERSKRGLSMNGSPSITQRSCAKLRTDSLPLVEDGIQVMKQAMELRPDYDDAMGYLNLLYRERAEIECNNKAARSSDLQEANEWTSKAMETRKRNAEKYKESESSTAQSRSPLTETPPPLAPPPPPPPPPKKPAKTVH